MKSLQNFSNNFLIPPLLAILFCLIFQSFLLAPEALRQGDIKKFKYKSYTFIVRESGGKHHIYLKKGVSEKEFKKPKVSYRNDQGIKVSENLRNQTKMFILSGSDEDLIWMFGEGPEGATPSFSGFYDFKGNLISYSYTLRISSKQAKLLNKVGDQQATLDGYCITNFAEQINNQETFQEKIGLW